MIVGSGIDICENYRIRHLLEKFGDRFLKRVYTNEEIEYCQQKKDPVPSLAARFAVKEAFVKALSIERNLNLSYRDVCLTGRSGKKTIQIQGQMREIAAKNHVTNIQFSISHARDYSCAVVILESTGSS